MKNVRINKDMPSCLRSPEIAVSVLTGGSDRPYVFGLATTLISERVSLDLIGSDELAFPEVRSVPGVNFLNLRGSSERNVSFGRKIFRVAMYYAKLIRLRCVSQAEDFSYLVE